MNYGEIYPQAVPVTEHTAADSRYAIAVEKPTLYNSPPPLPGTPNFTTHDASIQSPNSLNKHGIFEVSALSNRPRKIMGLRRRTFWTLCAVLIAIIIGAIVGGVVGSQSSKKSNSSGSTSGNSSGRCVLIFKSSFKFHLLL